MKSCRESVFYQKKKRSKILYNVVLSFFLILCIVVAATVWVVRPFVAHVGWEEFWSAKEVVHISKSKYVLDYYEGKTSFLQNFLGVYKARPEKSYRIAIGQNPGDKERPGDLKTPVGLFVIEEFYDSRKWVHDFGDGKGEIANAYGPWFMELRTGWEGIGIHGTHDDSSIGKMKTEGCIRLVNSNLLDLKKLVRTGTLVLITP